MSCRRSRRSYFLETIINIIGQNRHKRQLRYTENAPAEAAKPSISKESLL